MQPVARSPFVAMCIAGGLLASSLLPWFMPGLNGNAYLPWISLVLGTAGLQALYVASNMVRGEFEEDTSHLQPSDGRRGGDPSGWTGGRSEAVLGGGERRDAVEAGRAYEGLEGPLRPAELLLAEANLRHDEVAAARWAASEAADSDLTEAGFERLGDLIAANRLTRPGPEETFHHLNRPSKPEEP
ncbi:MAG: hypothetical protein CMB38_01810 [Euryarchaeota archaeon]|nr:hypothetical protein [Euryarchaeota archaeon]